MRNCLIIPPHDAPPKDSQLESLKVPPHSIEAEQSVLGGLLLDNAAWGPHCRFPVAERLLPLRPPIIFERIGKLIAATRPADVITVYEALDTAGKAEEVGGLAYLNALAQNTPSAANIRRYAEIVRDRAVLRRLVSVADRNFRRCLQSPGQGSPAVARRGGIAGLFNR